MPRPTLQSPRMHLASSGYDTRNLHNPFQDTSSFSTKNTSAPNVAPISSDTIPAISSSSSFNSASSSISTSLLSNDRSHAPLQRRENSNSSLLANDQIKSNSSSSQLYRQSSNSGISQPQSHQQSQQYNQNSISKQQRGSTSVSEHEPDQDRGQEQEQEQEQENPLIYLTASQREAAVENLEIETMDRTQKLRASIGVLTNSLQFRSEAEFNRLPAAIRTMTVEEFWFTYNGSAKEYLEQQTVKKSIANTSFLRALGITDHKKKRETMEQSNELWRLNAVERTSNNSARFKPYPSIGQTQSRHNSRPFVDSRLGQNADE